jgi:DNA-binding CsgD family transcriptional regulator
MFGAEKAAAKDALTVARYRRIMALRGAGRRAEGSNAYAPASLERYRRRFSEAVADALRLASDGRLPSCREALVVLEHASGRSDGERALCRALLALTAVALGDHAAARRYNRQVIAASARRGRRTPAYELRYLRMARALLAALAAQRRAQRASAGPLTATEVAVLKLVSQGHSAPEIATLMGRSAHTIRTHIRNAGGKLEAHGRLAMVTRAQQLGLLPTV